MKKPPRFTDSGREIYEFDLNEKQLRRMNLRAESLKARNQQRFEEDAKYVWHLGKRELINPEYLERARATKELREKLQNYTGSPEAASDLLFALKKEVDQNGQDFTQIAKKKTQEMVGAPVVADLPVPAKLAAARVAWEYWRYFWNRISGGLLYKKVGDV